MTDSKKIIKWMQTHPLISINALEVEAGMPQRTLNKAISGLDGRSIPEKYIPELKRILKRYGYKD